MSMTGEFMRLVRANAGAQAKADQAPVVATGTLAIRTGTKTWDPASMADGASTNTTVTITGAGLGDVAVASLTVAVPAGVLISAAVTAADTVTVTLHNVSGGAVDLASSTLRAYVFDQLT